MNYFLVTSQRKRRNSARKQISRGVKEDIQEEIKRIVEQILKKLKHLRAGKMPKAYHSEKWCD